MRVRAIPARQASITGGEPGDAPRARASIRSNFVLWIPVEKWISHGGPDAECPLEPIQPTGVVGEDLLLLAVVEVPALADLVDRGRPRMVPVREVGSVDDLVLADQLDCLRQQPLVGLAREVDVARAHVFA